MIHSIICFNTGIFPSPKESAHYRRLKLPWIESPYCLCIPTGCSIFAYQDNRSIVSAFAHPNVRVRESRICSLISPLAYIAHRNVMLSKTHPSTDIFDSANIWLGDAVISVISFSAYLVGSVNNAFPLYSGRFSFICPRTVLTRLHVYGSPSVTSFYLSQLWIFALHSAHTTKVFLCI